MKFSWSVNPENERFNVMWIIVPVYNKVEAKYLNAFIFLRKNFAMENAPIEVCIKVGAETRPVSWVWLILARWEGKSVKKRRRLSDEKMIDNEKNYHLLLDLESV